MPPNNGCQIKQLNNRYDSICGTIWNSALCAEYAILPAAMRLGMFWKTFTDAVSIVYLFTLFYINIVV